MAAKKFMSCSFNHRSPRRRRNSATVQSIRAFLDDRTGEERRRPCVSYRTRRRSWGLRGSVLTGTQRFTSSSAVDLANESKLANARPLTLASSMTGSSPAASSSLPSSESTTTSFASPQAPLATSMSLASPLACSAISRLSRRAPPLSARLSCTHPRQPLHCHRHLAQHLHQRREPGPRHQQLQQLIPGPLHQHVQILYLPSVGAALPTEPRLRARRRWPRAALIRRRSPLPVSAPTGRGNPTRDGTGAECAFGKRGTGARGRSPRFRCQHASGRACAAS